MNVRLVPNLTFVYLELHSSGFYAMYSGNSVLTFRDNLSVPFSTVGSPRRIDRFFPEASGSNYHVKLREIPEERRSHLHRGGSLKPRVGLLSLLTELTKNTVVLKCDLNVLEL